MPKCPECKRKIVSLEYRAYELRSGLMDRESKYSGLVSEDVLTDSIRYCCPACGHVIAVDEDSAIRFLRGQS